MINISRLACIIIFVFSSVNIYAQSINLDKQLGLEGAKQIESEMGIYSHTIATNYVQSVGNKLINSIYPLFDYNFHIVEMKEPNAFALPGGHIYISRGLLSLLNSEDELSGILGHEIAHSELRHSVKQMRRGILPAILQLPGEIVGSVVDENLGQIINTPLNASSNLFLASYSRRHEKQADKYGTKLMAYSGYNPEYFPKVLSNLAALVEILTGDKEEFGYFDSHPYTPRRVNYLNKEIVKISTKPSNPLTKNRAEFLNKFNGICVGSNPEYGIFNDNNFLHPELNLFVSFPKKWATDNQPNVVGAIDTTDNKSMVVLGIASKDKTPEEIGSKFLEGLKKEYNIKPERAESIDLNGMNAYLVALKDSTGGEVIGIYSLWFSMDNTTYQMLGLAKENNFEKLKNTALSIRSLSTKEKSSITILTLKIGKAKAGESISEFNSRTGNSWNVQMTAVLNDIDENEFLKDGQLIKIAIREKYLKQ